MTFRTKGIIRPSVERQEQIKSIVREVLRAATEVGAQRINATGLSFVMVGMGEWALDVIELDADAGVRFLRALTVLTDPRSSSAEKAEAEGQRHQAFRDLCLALDLMMQPASGHA